MDAGSSSGANPKGRSRTFENAVIYGTVFLPDLLQFYIALLICILLPNLFFQGGNKNGN